ncbi:MAG TPA: penicillin-insensitive murein endopeptidase [Polyangiaceae bacterium]|nr:penicillin-insensitive murein endopeptidase [Polyangiaceae bacterium]
MIERKVRAHAARSSGLPAPCWLAVWLLSACGLAPLPRDATSYGSANRGVLISSQALAQTGPGFVRANPGDDTRYGVPLLVSALERAARSVAEAHPGASPLRIGDVSGQGGGNHARHGSHRSGRDVDVLFYLLDERGTSIPGSGFFAFDERGVGAYQGRLTFFDTARNWSLVRSLLADEHALVQWIFCADGVKARLLAYAAVHERDPRVLLRAAYVLHQPSSGNPHRDHFHMRIACSADERARGCIDDGPTWPWWRNDHEKPSWEGPGNDDVTLLSALLGD